MEQQERLKTKMNNEIQAFWYSDALFCNIMNISPLIILNRDLILNTLSVENEIIKFIIKLQDNALILIKLENQYYKNNI